MHMMRTNATDVARSVVCVLQYKANKTASLVQCMAKKQKNNEKLKTNKLMEEEIAFENWQISDYEGLVTLNLDWVTLHTSCITHRPLPTYQMSLKSKKLFADGRTDVRANKNFRHTLFRSTRRSQPKKRPVQKKTVWAKVRKRQPGRKG